MPPLIAVELSELRRDAAGYSRAHGETPSRGTHAPELYPIGARLIALVPQDSPAAPADTPRNNP